MTFNMCNRSIARPRHYYLAQAHTRICIQTAHNSAHTHTHAKQDVDSTVSHVDSRPWELCWRGLLRPLPSAEPARPQQSRSSVNGTSGQNLVQGALSCRSISNGPMLSFAKTIIAKAGCCWLGCKRPEAAKQPATGRGCASIRHEERRRSGGCW